MCPIPVKESTSGKSLQGRRQALYNLRNVDKVRLERTVSLLSLSPKDQGPLGAGNGMIVKAMLTFANPSFSTVREGVLVAKRQEVLIRVRD